MIKSKTGRKLLLVNPKMQIKYLMLVIGLFVIVATYLAVDNLYYLKEFIPQADPEYSRNLMRMAIGMSVKIILLAVIFSFLGLYLSSRIAGPMHRLAQDILRMSEQADLTVSFPIRKHDELKEISQSLNLLVERLRSRLIDEEQFRKKVRITSKAMILLLKNKRQISKEEKQKLIQAGNILLQESSVSPIQFKI